jgi:hypothetical protein
MSPDTAPDNPAYSKALRGWLTLLAVASILWLGGFALRTIIGNEFFVPATLEYEPGISLDQERTLFQLIFNSTIVVMSSYALVLISAIVVLRLIPLRFKDNGWLLMASLLFFLFVPVEIFTGYLDLKFMSLWMTTKDILNLQGLQAYEEHSTLMRETLSHRIGALGGLPVIATLSYFAAICVIIWQPLKKRAGA